MNNQRKEHQKTIIMKLGDISKKFKDYMRTESDKIGLNCAYRPILFHLIMSDGLTQAEIAEKTLLKAPTISLTLQKMEYEGLVERKTDEVDQRQTRVFCTSKGHEIFNKSHEIANNLENRIIAHLSKEEIVLANDIIDKILNATLEEVEKNENI